MKLKYSRGSLLVELLMVMPLILSILWGIVVLEELSSLEINISKNENELESYKNEAISYLYSGLAPSKLISMKKKYVIEIIRQTGDSYVFSISHKTKTGTQKDTFVWAYKK